MLRFRYLLPCLPLLLLAGAPATTERIPDLIWPVGRANMDGVFVQLGPDTDPATGSWEDWECFSQFTYDGHRGTDIMAYNFRLMDQGVTVLAAADGRVTWTQTGNFDRNYWTPYIGDPNGINIRHDDGSNSQYFHLRQHSISVEVGDQVEAGQVIGYIGSSGSSPNPHLHFELWENGISRDPNNGACNGRPSLWIDAFDHPAAQELKLLDWDVFLDTNLSGVEGNNYLGDHRLKNRPFRPVTVDKTTEKLGIWVQVQGMVGSQYTVRILDPTGAEFDAQAKGVAFPRSVQWHPLYFDFGARASTMESPEGMWTAELIMEGEPVRSRTFEVGDATTFPLRFFPLAGRSLKRTGGTVRDTLRVRSAVGAVSYSLLGAPSGVSIDGDEVLVEESAPFPTRNAEFQVVAQDEAGRRDTMYYHVVSPGQPLAGASIGAVQLDVHPLQLTAYPNPTSGEVSLTLDVPAPGIARLEVYDLLGRRRVERSLGTLSAGRHGFRQDLAGLAGGVYFLRVRVGETWGRSAVTVRPR